MVHFTHARKVEKLEKAPASHKARPTWEYVDYIEKMKISEAKNLYSELCSIVHPAADSVSMLFSSDGDFFTASPNHEKRILEHSVAKSRGVLSDVLMASCNPPLLILKVLHKFKLFTPLHSLNSYSFDNITIWPKIEKALRN
ncbi:hypothetical protein ACFSQQ_16560 [Mesorhizobium kowhaii]|uniref:hypothetical protein n=1 Tax=Mesorhizobium kowhaii TaxID=1300272 RepID=UPI0035EBBD2C